jgi:hypothetical protein
MTPAEKDKFLNVLQGVHDFYGRDMSAFAVTVWAMACETFDVEQVSKALSAHLMDPERGQFMPKPADIVRQLQGTNTDRSLIAWGKVLDAMQRVGAYATVCFDDGLIHAAITDMGGWMQLCRGKVDELPFLQKRFCDGYKAYANRGDVVYPAVLLGEHEIANNAKGYVSASPVLIGNPDKAVRVRQSGVIGPKTQITHIADNVSPIKRLENAA